jgi:hypothetical protein
VCTSTVCLLSGLAPGDPGPVPAENGSSQWSLQLQVAATCLCPRLRSMAASRADIRKCPACKVVHELQTHDLLGCRHRVCK